jgi:DNA-binding CsgD family transcriptional regulator
MQLTQLIAISEARDLAELEQRLIEAAQGMDFGIVSAAMAVTVPGEATRFQMIGNTPQSFVEASRRQAATARDPVMQRLKMSHVPFWYDQRFYLKGGAADLYEEQLPHGYRTGVAMAMHLSGGRHFLLGMDRDTALPCDEAALMRLIADMHLVTVYAQEAAARLMLPAAKAPGGAAAVPKPTVRLTPRELEVLNWTREGKSAWAVGQILSMSEATVNFHLRNVMGKLGVSNKHVALLRAAALGLIAQN